MKCDLCGAPVKKKKVNFTIEYQEKLYIIQQVPAKVCTQCGEKLYSPKTVSNIQEAIWKNNVPVKIIETPVLNYAIMG